MRKRQCVITTSANRIYVNYVHLYVVCLLAHAGTRQWRTTVLGGFCQFSITAKYVKNLQLHVSKGNVLC